MPDYQQQLLRALLAYVTQRGADPKRLCALSNIDARILQQGHPVAVTATEVNSLWKNAAHAAEDPLFGLHFGEAMQLAALGVVGQIIQTSNTISEAVAHAGALTPLLTDMFCMQTEHGAKQFSMRFVADPVKAADHPHTFKHFSAFIAVFAVHELDGLLMRRLSPVTVQLPYDVEETAEFERVLRCPLKKKGEALTLTFDNSWLHQEILSANYELQSILLQQVHALQAGAQPAGDFHARIFQYLLSNSYLYSASLESVAANFSMSPRSLQRKLAGEGVTFLQVQDEVRKALALDYLRSGHHSVKDIAYMLGYNESSAFLKAFKRWTGKTPGEMRTA
ncbi:AraC family transcriptional regulator [Chitinophaga rhizosphaerae]|uniref:AraC family transcriptional regulator n=1 Tax=Chitinophaga rhizosphaerae TaxID=1864947 RepID=UPI000F81428F|nr:AraC family transcriptional regulator [Chitinophaga rhizosphaerae]